MLLFRSEAGRLLVTLLAMLPLMLPGVGLGMEPDIIGSAYDLETGEQLYSEQHFCVETAQNCTVLYRDTEGVLVADKELDYSSSLLAPALEINDYRRDEFVRLNSSSDPRVVVDAGFDNFVRSRWDTLAGGGSVEFPFLVVGREDPLNMRAVNSDDADCIAGELCLRVELESWLLRMVVAPVRLTYDRDSRRLLRFRGISNIRSPSGKTQQVDIRYSYPVLAHQP